MTKQQEMIRHVMEEEGMIRRNVKRIREAIRETGEAEPDSREKGMEEDQNVPEDVKARRIRVRIMLDLIPEPKSRTVDGEQVTEGMSYSDAEILMECYNSVNWFTQEMLKKA